MYNPLFLHALLYARAPAYDFYKYLPDLKPSDSGRRILDSLLAFADSEKPRSVDCKPNLP